MCRVVQVAADLFDPARRRRCSCERALDEFGRIDILVNNMGGGGDPTPAAQAHPRRLAAGLRAELLLVGAHDGRVPAHHARPRSGAGW